MFREAKRVGTENSLTKTKMYTVPVLVGIAAGLVNGYLGSGGGVVLMFAYAYLYSGRAGFGAKDCFASTVISVLPMSVVSAVSYYESGRMDFQVLAPFIIPGIIGGILGGWLTDKVKGETMKYLFAAILIYSGVRMYMKA